MTESNKIIAGIDVGKQGLDVSIAGAKVKHYPNTDKGIERLIAALLKNKVTQAVCEATGGYEEALMDQLRTTDIIASRVHPPRVRQFARATGVMAKTDVMDAHVLVEFGMKFDVPATPALDANTLKLRHLLTRRDQCVQMRVQEKNRLKQIRSAEMVEDIEAHIAYLTVHIKQLEAKCAELLDEDDSLANRSALYQSVKGIGTLTAGAMLAHLPELGEFSGKEMAALVGVAPWTRESGQWKGKGSICGGRPIVRRVLYTSALSAIRYNPDMKRFYLGLRRRGKPGKVALVAVMRKMLLLLNTIAHRDTPWVENYLPTAQKPLDI